MADGQPRCRTYAQVGLLCAIGAVLAGCGTLSNGREWGQDATLVPGKERLKRAAIEALRDPMIWGPAAGAAVFGLSELDERVSAWASENTPIFGSPTRADNASDSLLAATNASYLVTGLATPSGNEPSTWALAKLKGLGVEYAAVRVTGMSTDVLKQWTDRERPDGSDRSSFPSRHSSTGFARATLAARNIGFLPLGDHTKTAMKVGVMTLAAGTAWARVEAQKHFPSDVLAGAALGNFIASFVHDAFLGLAEDRKIALSVAPSRRGLTVGIASTF